MILQLNDGRVTVPANRWDLLAGRSAPPARIGVVVPFYEQHDQLPILLRALELQDHPGDLVDVVVVDDGSSVAPDVSGSALGATVVRQADEGFRAAAARNLGAAHTDADVLCFLDADMVPEPSYLRRISQLAALLPDALVVGRRRHADLSGCSPESLPGWWAGIDVPTELPEPGWLSDAYRDSDDLLRIDHRSYRYVISSVMCCSRILFEDIGGFDESFREYGGEDWEFAHRALVNGAVLQHAPAAVAWHDGPDWAGRSVADRAAVKNREALAVARLVSDPDARRPGLRHAVPDVAVQIDVTEHGLGSLVTTVGCFLGEDVGMWLTGPRASTLHAQLGFDDPRIAVGPIPDWIRRRCRFTVSVSGRPVLPRAAVTRLLTRCAAPGVAEVRVTGAADVEVVCRASWASNRARRWSGGEVRWDRPTDVASLGATVTETAAILGLTNCERDASLTW